MASSYHSHVSSAQSQIFSRLLEPIARCMTPASARGVLEFRLDEVTKRRIQSLGKKANRGRLTPHEESEYRDYIDAIDLVAILQAKARRRLERKA